MQAPASRPVPGSTANGRYVFRLAHDLYDDVQQSTGKGGPAFSIAAVMKISAREGIANSLDSVRPGCATR